MSKFENEQEKKVKQAIRDAYSDYGYMNFPEKKHFEELIDKIMLRIHPYLRGDAE